MRGIAAVHQLDMNKGRLRREFIFPDSSSALTAIQSIMVELKLTIEYHKRLIKRRVVKFLWILRHSGIRGNDIPDDLARLGAPQPFISSEPSVGVSYTQITFPIVKGENIEKA